LIVKEENIGCNVIMMRMAPTRTVLPMPRFVVARRTSHHTSE
jgi:hypothetical protein